MKKNKNWLYVYLFIVGIASLSLFQLCKITKPVSSLPNSSAPTAGGSPYPYSDESTLNYMGYQLEESITNNNHFNYVEISDEWMPMYRQFCNDGSGSYHTAQGIRLRLNRKLDCNPNLASSLHSFSIGQSDGHIESHKNYNLYKSWSSNSETPSILSDYLIMNSGKSTTEISSLRLETCDLYCISSKFAGNTIIFSKSNDLSILDKETYDLINYMKEILYSDSASTVNNCPMAISYYYQVRHSNSSQEENRFIFYAFFIIEGNEYLVHFTSQYKSAGGGQPNADESQECFNNLLDEISSLLISAQ